ncbi:MAG: alpha/beta fold hydrolase [Gemmatimonadota bacterium]
MEGAVEVQRPAVLLVPGWSDTALRLRACSDYLVQSGWSAGHVRRLDFRDRFGSNVGHAEEVADAVAALSAATGQPRVAVVAHSMGGLALRRCLIDTNGSAVHTAVFVGTPHMGTLVAWAAWGRGGAEMRPGSEFLRDLNARSLPPTVRAVCLRTPIDTRVIPGSSAWLEGTECMTVRLPPHSRMLRHRPTLQQIVGILAAPAADSTTAARYTRTNEGLTRAAGGVRQRPARCSSIPQSGNSRH